MDIDASTFIGKRWLATLNNPEPTSMDDLCSSFSDNNKWV